MTDWPQGNADVDYDFFYPVLTVPNCGPIGYGSTAIYASTCAPVSSFLQAAQAVSLPGPDWQVIYMGPDFNGPQYDWTNKIVRVKSSGSMAGPAQINSMVAAAYQRGRLAAQAEFSALQQPLKGSPPPAVERPAVGQRKFRFKALKESPAAE